MKNIFKLPFLTILVMLISSQIIFAQSSVQDTTINSNKQLVRISEIEVYPKDFDAYCAILKEEAAASVKLEPGVIAIFPMYIKADRSQIRILEIYANDEAYQQHLKTPHFQKYKTTTLTMVKSLKLLDMAVLDKETMSDIFKK
ncbi:MULTISPECIES: putative quinol monooxygenase [unclassified Sphingobacterium]|uniref:putative quinol monooxygenase n=1 Tax=unclassified Sphingobacterium TaxID=2609468 RepID=UPI00038A55E1|nr:MULTISPECIES: antibiotic biosynthesis monooxygenase family protein [unclassified Sphingobacterium]QQD12857.1 antibiotic biosynthesis monooxygenase [Sphingobacterium sp. UDSM-2020]